MLIMYKNNKNIKKKVPYKHCLEYLRELYFNIFNFYFKSYNNK